MQCEPVQTKLAIARILQYGANYRCVFMGRGFTAGGQELGSVFSASVCIIQASKRYIESLPLVLKGKRSCFSQGERFAVQLPLERVLALRK